MQNIFFLKVKSENLNYFSHLTVTIKIDISGIVPVLFCFLKLLHSFLFSSLCSMVFISCPPEIKKYRLGTMAHTLIPALQEAEVGESPEVRSFRPAWPNSETPSLLTIQKLAGHGDAYLGLLEPRRQRS